MRGCDMLLFFFFFKQKTAYEIPKRDWSSDVCSSDLVLSTRSCSGCLRNAGSSVCRSKSAASSPVTASAPLAATITAGARCRSVSRSRHSTGGAPSSRGGKRRSTSARISSRSAVSASAAIRRNCRPKQNAMTVLAFLSRRRELPLRLRGGELGDLLLEPLHAFAHAARLHHHGGAGDDAQQLLGLLRGDLARAERRDHVARGTACIGFALDARQFERHRPVAPRRQHAGEHEPHGDVVAHLGEADHAAHERFAFVIEQRLEHEGLLVAGTARPAGRVAALSRNESHVYPSVFTLILYRSRKHSARSRRQSREGLVKMSHPRRIAQ